MKKKTKNSLNSVFLDCVLYELKETGHLKQNQYEFSSFSQEMDQIKLDLEELYSVMKTLKQYMKDINGLEKSWKNIENLNNQ